MESIVKFRNDLHQIPELGFKEFLTQKYLYEQIVELGYKPNVICETGLYIYINLGKASTIAFRSDIDGLPIKEESDFINKSKIEGHMHACGHDGHMAILLSFLNHLKIVDLSNVKYNLLLIFQPAEEGPGGAKEIVKTGIFSKYNVVKIFGLHIWPDLEEGIVASKSGPLMASSCEIDLEFIGKSTHVGMPHLGVNALSLGAEYLKEVDAEVKAYFNQKEHYVVGFGKFQAGTIRNIIAHNAIAEGTIRTFSKETNNSIISIFNKIKQKYEIKHNLKTIINDRYLYYPTINDEKLYQELVVAFKDDNYLELKEAYLTAEDFSYYQREIPGVFYFIGSRNVDMGYIHPLHSSKFNFSNNVLKNGLQSYINILNSYRG